MYYLWLVSIMLLTFTQTSPASASKNVLGTELSVCSQKPMTGFYRNGICETGPNDGGVHVVCAEVTEEFLKFTKSQGNDLITPAPDYRFPGLKAGDRWCLCAKRWKEAHKAKVAPPVILEATHQKALKFVPLMVLKEHPVKN